MKRLVLLTPPVPPYNLGGDGKFAYDIAIELGNLGIEVTLVSVFFNKRIPPYSPTRHVSVIPVCVEDREATSDWDVPMWDPVLVSRRDAKILDTLQENRLIGNHCWLHEIGGTIYNRTLASLHHNGIQYSCHMQFALENYFRACPSDEPIRQLIMRSQRALVSGAALSMFLCAQEMTPFLSQAARTVIVPNGIKLREYKTASRQRTGRDFHIFLGGRLHSPVKGAAQILPTLSRVLERSANTVLHVCAPDDSYLDLIAPRARDQLIYHGWLSPDQVSEVIRQCDIGLIPSIYEPFGLLAIEILASRIPIMACATGGLRDIVIPGENGEFMDLSDRAAIEERLLDLARNPAALRSLARDPRAGLERYDIRHVAELYVEHLGPLVGM